MLSKKYYELIAKAINDNTSITEKGRITKRQFIDRLVSEFRADNINFDAFKFRKACETVFDGTEE